jgi:hypothetical protein
MALRFTKSLLVGKGLYHKTCAGYLFIRSDFERLNSNFKKRSNPNPSFRHILQDPKYKKPTIESRFLSSLVKKVTSCGPDGDRTRGA